MIILPMKRHTVEGLRAEIAWIQVRNHIAPICHIDGSA
jgi:hypothetical protein